MTNHHSSVVVILNPVLNHCCQISLNLTKHSIDYIGSIVSYLAIAIPVFSGKFGEEEDIASVVSAVSVCVHMWVCLHVYE